MSYIRAGHPLKYFEGTSNLYVFADVENYVEDYDTKYEDNASLAELLVRFVELATGDYDYAWKIAGVLAEKLNVQRRKKPLSFKEWLLLSDIKEI